jgi:HAMP domain-containing protein
MLRRKLLTHLGPLVLLFLGTAVGAIWLLQGVLEDIEHIHGEAWQAVEDVNELAIAINVIELDLYELHVGSQPHLDKLMDSVERARRLVSRLGSHYVCRETDGEQLYLAIAQYMPAFERQVSTLATVEDAGLVRQHTEAASAMALTLRKAALPLSQHVRTHALEEQEMLANSFQRLVLGLAIAFLVVINISIAALLHMGLMIVRPVDRLVEASAALGREEFDHRVDLEQHDEFGQLARAYNKMADKLAVNEQRKMEVLSQAALAMNHELNNAMSIIELQLQMMSRQAHGNPAAEKCLFQIRESLQRMARTVQSLKSVRRIVLTDYIPGTKMLDLERSMQEESQEKVLAAASSDKIAT